MLDRDSVVVTVEDIVPFNDEHGKGFKIYWHGSIGFGEYTIYKDDDGIWKADSEYMDSKDDMWFLSLLMKDFMQKQIGAVK